MDTSNKLFLNWDFWILAYLGHFLALCARFTVCVHVHRDAWPKKCFIILCKVFVSPICAEQGMSWAKWKNSALHHLCICKICLFWLLSLVVIDNECGWFSCKKENEFPTLYCDGLAFLMKFRRVSSASCSFPNSIDLDDCWVELVGGLPGSLGKLSSTSWHGSSFAFDDWAFWSGVICISTLISRN